MIFLTGCSESSLPTNLTLLRANEVEEILNGDDEKYRALTMNSDSAASRGYVTCANVFSKSTSHD
jgi:hypothetical protein